MSRSTAVVRIVGIDTATRAGSVALIEAAGDAAPVSRAEVAHEEDLRHAETLLPAIDQCLFEAGCELADVDGFAVSIGPGSFTGLRVGLATAKGLALATGAWLVGVPTLEAHARAAVQRGQATAGPLCAFLDARKGEVYSALFEVDVAGEAATPPRVRRVLDDAVEPPEGAARRVLNALSGAIERGATLRVVGDGAARYGDALLEEMRRRLPVEVLPDGPAGRGIAIADLGHEIHRREGPADVAYLAPAYLRASEAELKLRERRKRGPGGVPSTGGPDAD